MAGALDIRLSGPRSYHGTLTDDPWVNATGADATPASIHRALSLYTQMLWCAMAALVLLIIVGTTP